MYTYKSLPLSVAEADRRHEVEHAHAERKRFGLFLGRVAARYGVAKAARLGRVSERAASYWKRKARDPAFHPGAWGGSRMNSMLFGSTENDMFAQAVTYLHILKNPETTFRELLNSIRTTPGFEHTSPWWLSTTIKSWGWDWARTRLVSRNKYTDDNVREWIEYALRVLDIPLSRVRERASVFFDTRLTVVTAVDLC